MVTERLPARLMCDPVRLRQVLVNLLHNAIKFTDQGHVRLSLSTAAETAASIRLRFEVLDTGIGIAQDQIDSVFDAFTQADASSTRRHGGSGLGLTIVRELVDLMGGTLGVVSHPGRGSAFWFEAEFEKAAEPAPAAVPAPPPARNGLTRALGVEDDPVNQMVIEAMLNALGCEVNLAEDGGAARAAVQRARYDIVFVDCHMPTTDGFEATRLIRQDEAGVPFRTPIVALTADALAGDRERCLTAGMDDFMTKPVSRDRLAGAIGRWAVAGGASPR